MSGTSPAPGQGLGAPAGPSGGGGVGSLFAVSGGAGQSQGVDLGTRQQFAKRRGHGGMLCRRGTPGHTSRVSLHRVLLSPGWMTPSVCPTGSVCASFSNLQASPRRAQDLCQSVEGDQTRIPPRGPVPPRDLGVGTRGREAEGACRADGGDPDPDSPRRPGPAWPPTS